MISRSAYSELMCLIMYLADQLYLSPQIAAFFYDNRLHGNQVSSYSMALKADQSQAGGRAGASLTAGCMRLSGESGELGFLSRPGWLEGQRGGFCMSFVRVPAGRVNS